MSTNQNSFLDAAQTAKRHCINLKILERYRKNGKGPKFIQCKDVFLYPIEATDYFFQGVNNNGK